MEKQAIHFTGVKVSAPNETSSEKGISGEGTTSKPAFSDSPRVPNTPARDPVSFAEVDAAFVPLQEAKRDFAALN